VIPAQQMPAALKTSQFWHASPLEPDRIKPHSHLLTGMVLRAFAARPQYRRTDEVTRASKFLCARFFKPEKNNDRRAASYWLKFQFPFWWPNLPTALDILSWLGFTSNDLSISEGLNWFFQNQARDGLWEAGYPFGSSSFRDRTWVGLAICRVLKRYFFEYQEVEI
jgi:hypothetical protein